MNRKKLIRKYDKQSRIYARKPMMYALSDWRRRLLRHASGDVLELAVGTGVNFAYYPDAVTNITGVDFSPQMLAYAEKAAQKSSIPVQLQQADIERLSVQADSYDTVVSTLSLCGYDEPLRMLDQFSDWCRPSGNILLLEHGLSSNAGCAVLQKWINPLHYHIIGCHQTRDLSVLLQSAQLQIADVERHWLGAFYLIWAKPGLN